MPLEVSFRNLKPREEIRKRAEVLYGKVERFLDPDADAQLMVNVEHSSAVIELVVVTHGDTLKAEEEDADLLTSLNKTFHNMEMQLRRRKERNQDRRQRGDERPDGFLSEDA